MTKRREINQAEPEGDFDLGDALPQPLPDYLQKLVKQLVDSSDWSERLRAVGELTAFGDEKAYAFLLNVLLRDDPLLHRAVECELSKKGANEWLRLFHADDAEWKRLIESGHPILSDAIVSRYAQQRIIGVLRRGCRPLPEELLIRYFAVSEKDTDEYECALGLVENHKGSSRFEAFKRHLDGVLQRARDNRVDPYVTGLSSRSSSVRLKSVRLLAKTGAVRAAVPQLIKLLCDRSPIVRNEVVTVLSQLGYRAVPGLIMALVGLDIKVFKKVVELLLPLDSGKDVRRLLAEIMLTHAGPEFRAVAIQAMKHFNSANVVGDLQKSAAEDPSPKNRASAAKVLRAIQKRSAQGNNALK